MSQLGFRCWGHSREDQVCTYVHTYMYVSSDTRDVLKAVEDANNGKNHMEMGMGGQTEPAQGRL